MTSIAVPPSASHAPEHTGSRLTRVLGGVTVVAWIVWLTYGLVLSPADVVQSESVRLFYLHVPLALPLAPMSDKCAPPRAGHHPPTPNLHLPRQRKSNSESYAL